MENQSIRNGFPYVSVLIVAFVISNIILVLEIMCQRLTNSSNPLIQTDFDDLDQMR